MLSPGEDPLLNECVTHMLLDEYRVSQAWGQNSAIVHRNVFRAASVFLASSWVVGYFLTKTTPGLSVLFTLHESTAHGTELAKSDEGQAIPDVAVTWQQVIFSTVQSWQASQ